MCSADRFSRGSGCSSEQCDLYWRVYCVEQEDTSAKQRIVLPISPVRGNAKLLVPCLGNAAP